VGHGGNLSSVVPANAGTHNPGRLLLQRISNTGVSPKGLGVWVPAPRVKLRTRQGRRMRDSVFKLQMQLRDLAACFARALLVIFRPLQSEGAGNAGRPMRPIPRMHE
jgi:hypothetical protein